MSGREFKAERARLLGLIARMRRYESAGHRVIISDALEVYLTDVDTVLEIRVSTAENAVDLDLVPCPLSFLIVQVYPITTVRALRRRGELSVLERFHAAAEREAQRSQPDWETLVALVFASGGEGRERSEIDQV